jgi:hypothetical protein
VTIDRPGLTPEGIEKVKEASGTMGQRRALATAKVTSLRCRRAARLCLISLARGEALSGKGLGREPAGRRSEGRSRFTAFVLKQATATVIIKK